MYSVATSTSYAGRLSLLWPACNVATALSLLQFHRNIFISNFLLNYPQIAIPFNFTRSYYNEIMGAEIGTIQSKLPKVYMQPKMRIKLTFKAKTVAPKSKSRPLPLNPHLYKT